MKNLRGVIAALVVVGVGVLGVFALQASSITGAFAADSCVNGTKYTDFDGSYSGRDTMTVWPIKPLCKDANVNFGSFTINNTYNGQGFKNNPTALPQTAFYNRTVTLKKGTSGKTTVTVKVPDACTDYQIDAYVGPVQTKITTNAGLVNTTAIVGKAFQRLKNDCSPKMVKVCNPATGKIISVPESEAGKYKPEGDKACQLVKVCNPATGQIITVPASEASKYKPVDDAACKPKPKYVQVCDPATGKIISVPESEADKYKPVDDKACQSKPKMVKVCDPSTGKIISVPEADADKYKPVDDKACKPVKVCDPETGKIIVVKPSEADNYKPVGDKACQDITVCRLSDKTIVTIKASEYDSSKYSKNLDDCKPPTPHKVYVCNPETGEIIQVDEADQDKYKPVDDEACKNVQVCDPSTGQIITVKKAKADQYKPVDDEACTETPVTPVTPETPSTPQVMGDETTTPAELPSTGPEQAVTALFGAGSLAGASTAYIRARRALRK